MHVHVCLNSLGDVELIVWLSYREVLLTNKQICCSLRKEGEGGRDRIRRVMADTRCHYSQCQGPQQSCPAPRLCV